LICLSLIPFFTGCGPSYPKKSITQSVERVVKQKYGLNSTATLVGKTLYLDIKLSGLLTTDPDKLAPILKKVTGAAGAVTHVALSSDANVDYLISTAADPSWKIYLRVIERVEDIKNAYFLKISMPDAEERAIVELEVGNKEATPPQPAPMMGLDVKKDMELKEFIGRLIVSQVNMMTRRNPFLSVLFDNAQLRFEGQSDTELVIKVTNKINPASFSLLEKIINAESVKTLKKYKTWQPQTVSVLGQDEKALTIDLSPARTLP
jgi:hypothetical protein